MAYRDKEKKRLALQAWRTKNRERVNAYAREHRSKPDRETVKKRRARYYARHKPEINARSAAWNRSHRERTAEASRRWYAKHRREELKRLRDKRDAAWISERAVRASVCVAIKPVDQPMGTRPSSLGFIGPIRGYRPQNTRKRYSARPKNRFYGIGWRWAPRTHGIVPVRSVKKETFIRILKQGARHGSEKIG